MSESESESSENSSSDESPAFQDELVAGQSVGKGKLKATSGSRMQGKRAHGMGSVYEYQRGKGRWCAQGPSRIGTRAKHLGIFPSRELALLVLKTYIVFCKTHKAKMKKKYPNKAASEIDSLVAAKWERCRSRGYTASSDESLSNDTSSDDLSSRDGMLSGESSSENCYSAVSLAEEQTCSKDKKETKRKGATPLREEAKRRKRYSANII